MINRYQLKIYFFFILLTSDIFSQTIFDLEPHPPSRIQTGMGGSKFGNFIELQYRPYSHDLLNRDYGYLRNSESGKFNTTIRYYQDKNRLEITKFSLIKLFTLTPYSTLNENKSYGLDIGLESVTVTRKDKIFDTNKTEFSRITPLSGEVLIGYSFENILGEKKSPLLVSLMAGAKSQFHSYFNDFMRVGPQAVVILIYDFGMLKLQYQGGYQYYQLSGNQNDYSNALKLRISLDAKQEFRIETMKTKMDQEVILSYLYMF